MPTKWFIVMVGRCQPILRVGNCKGAAHRRGACAWKGKEQKVWKKS